MILLINIYLSITLIALITLIYVYIYTSINISVATLVVTFEYFSLLFFLTDPSLSPTLMFCWDARNIRRERGVKYGMMRLSSLSCSLNRNTWISVGYHIINGGSFQEEYSVGLSRDDGGSSPEERERDVTCYIML